MVGVATEAKELTVLANRKSQLSERLDNQNGISFEKFQALTDSVRRFAEIVSDDFPIVHASHRAAFGLRKASAEFRFLNAK